MTKIPVCIFAKPPVAGRVKTRLARSIGESRAAELASAMLRDVWSSVAESPGVLPVLAAAECGDFGIDVPEERVWLQEPGNLGWRIECILRRGLETAPAAIALGADAPLITSLHLRDAINGLQSGDATIGPCHDGGFYLLGLRRCPPRLLTEITWSSEHTRSETEARLASHGMTVAQLGFLTDVDTVADLAQLSGELRKLPAGAAPRTRKWLDETGWSAS